MVMSMALEAMGISQILHVICGGPWATVMLCFWGRHASIACVNWKPDVTRPTVVWFTGDCSTVFGDSFCINSKLPPTAFLLMCTEQRQTSLIIACPQAQPAHTYESLDDQAEHYICDLVGCRRPS